MKQAPAIIVPCANRGDYLRVFLEHVPRYLERENAISEYLIVVAEQLDDGPYSASTARDVGALLALAHGTPSHLVFNDVDMLPASGIDYGYSGTPTICFMNFGGCKLSPDQFSAVNGYNPEVMGWGYEDREFYDRLETYGIDARRWDIDPASETALAIDLELEASDRAQELEHSRRYWRREDDRGPGFVAYRGPIQRYDRAPNWYSPEAKARNLKFANDVYNRYPEARKRYYREVGLSSLCVDGIRAELAGHVLFVRYERVKVLTRGS